MTSYDYRIRRSSTPEMTVSENTDSTIHGVFDLNVEPDLAWDHEFERLTANDERIPSQARVSRPSRSRRHPGLVSPSEQSRVTFSVKRADDLPGVVSALDACVAAANDHYNSVVLPEREAASRREQLDAQRRDAEQRRANELARKLQPPQ